MKSLAILTFGVLLGVAIMLFVPHAAPQIVYAGSPSGNGDVNASGAIDIADAIYLLTYLFAKGPEPEVITCDSCCPPPTGGALPATGQTACYWYSWEQHGWIESSCNSEEFAGQDGFYEKGCPTEGRFVDNGDGTVTDNCTGLMWQKETADVNGDGQISGEPFLGDVVPWGDALRYCDSLELADNDDWRLPNVRELQSIVDYGRSDPSIDPVFGAESGGYWSSSTYVQTPGNAWVVGLGYVATLDATTTLLYVRAVRDAR